MSKVFFVAEAGKNFIIRKEQDVIESLNSARRLVNRAKIAGANAVKFQTHVFEDEQHLRHSSRWEWIKFNESLTPYEDFWVPLKKLCDEVKIEFMATSMSTLAAKKVDSLVGRWKIGSASVTDYDLLKFINSTRKPVIMSTGMSTQKQVNKALELLSSCHVDLLYCKSVYPCSQEKINFLHLRAMKNFYSLSKIGFSDHTKEIATPMLAVLHGAEIIEKHFTLYRDAHGPDHFFSLSPEDLKISIQLVRDYEDINLTDAVIWPLEDEVKLWKTFRI